MEGCYGGKQGWGAIVAAIVLAWTVNNLHTSLQLWHGDILKVEIAESRLAYDCQRVMGPRGLEDIIPVDRSRGIFISGADDRLQLWERKGGGPLNTDQGSLHAIKLDEDGEVTIHGPLTLQGRPADVSFHPHGLDYFDETGELYVLSHGYHRGGEVVEVYELMVLSRPPWLEAQYKFTVPILAPSVGHGHGHFNEVAIFRRGEFYVTQWLSFGEPEMGKQSIWGTMVHQANVVNAALLRFPVVAIWRCSDDAHEQSWSCSPVRNTVGRGISYNGMMISRDGSQLLTADSLKRTIEVFNRTSSGDLLWSTSTAVPYAPDNINPLGEGDIGGIIVACSHGLSHLLLLGEAKKTSLGEPIKRTITGGACTIRPSTHGNFSSEVLFMQDGEMLSGISCAVSVNGNVSRPSQPAGEPLRPDFILGSWYDSGLLFCHGKTRAVENI